VVDRDADRLARLPLAHQVQALESIVRSNPVVAGVLDQLPALNLGSWYIGAGGVAGTVWNHLHGYAPTHGIKDYDIVYFHAEDLSEPQSRSVEHAIATWPTTATSIGVRCDGGANTTLVDEPVYRAKAERWCRTWPQVTALPWPSS
jgi:uncharacterized protein